jgi:hypothetical protein
VAFNCRESGIERVELLQSRGSPGAHQQANARPSICSGPAVLEVAHVDFRDPASSPASDSLSIRRTPSPDRRVSPAGAGQYRKAVPERGGSG